MAFSERHKRSASKAITFQVIVILVDIFIIYAITHEAVETAMLLVWTNVAGALLYYIHERYWNKIRWGKLGVAIDLMRK